MFLDVKFSQFSNKLVILVGGEMLKVMKQSSKVPFANGKNIKGC
jgi:hypothetical protein